MFSGGAWLTPKHYLLLLSLLKFRAINSSYATMNFKVAILPKIAVITADVVNLLLPFYVLLLSFVKITIPLNRHKCKYFFASKVA